MLMSCNMFQNGSSIVLSGANKKAAPVVRVNKSTFESRSHFKSGFVYRSSPLSDTVNWQMVTFGGDSVNFDCLGHS